VIENREDFLAKDNITVEGITEDYVWYQTKLLVQDMQSWQIRLEKLSKVMENRHSEHLIMIGKLELENYSLRKKVEAK
jgi:hypothetical protein